MGSAFGGSLKRLSLGQAHLEVGRACSSNSGETLFSSPRSHLHLQSPRLPLSVIGPLSATGPSQGTVHYAYFPAGPSRGVVPCAFLHVRSPRLIPLATGPSQGTVHCASFLAGLSQSVDPCASLLTAPTTIVMPLADVALLDEVLKFQKCTLPPSRSSWGEGPSSSSTPSWGPFSTFLGEDRGGSSLCLKSWGDSPEWEAGMLEARADVEKGPLSIVLQDGSEVVFPENASSEEDTSSDKEFSNFKDFNTFLGMPVEGYEEKIVLLLKKSKKMTGGGTLCKKKVVSTSHSEKELKRLDCSVSYGEPANRRSGRRKWELIPVD